ncbi:MAG: DUF4215 domain-containing protein [Deltaproteobacteria bacterium]
MLRSHHWSVVLATFASLLLPVAAQAGLSGASVSNASSGNNSNRISSVGIDTDNSSVLETRYRFGVGVDNGGTGTSSTTLNSNYTISFTVTAPGDYQLDIGVRSTDALTLNSDGGGSASTDMGAPSGYAVSAGETASSYPGPGSRDINNDGHFVSIALTEFAACGDGIVDAAEECDDGNNVDGDWCSALCTIEEGCGNNHVEISESCDDGNNSGGDGCSSRCQTEASQTKDQQKCITILNNLAVKVAATQGKENLKCLKNGGKDKLPEGQSIAACLESDPKGKLVKIAAKIKVTQDGHVDDPSKTKCPETPNFAYADDEVIVAAVAAEQRAFFAEILGDDVDAAAIDLTDKAQKKLGACQQVLVRASDKILQTQLKEFLSCKKDVLKNREAPAVSAEDLEACYGAIRNDVKGKVEKARVKLADAVGRKCTAFDHAISDALQGDCAATAADVADFSECVVDAGRCAACVMFNAADNLEEDCDVFDDGTANGSCGDSGGPVPSPVGAFVDGPIFAQF